MQLLSSDGLLLGEAVNVFEGTAQFPARGSVVSNKNEGGFLVTGVQTTEQGNQQVVARFVDVLSVCLPSPTPTPSATPTPSPTVTPRQLPVPQLHRRRQLRRGLLRCQGRAPRRIRAQAHDGTVIGCSRRIDPSGELNR